MLVNWHGLVHIRQAGSPVSELTETPNCSVAYCPGCDPWRDPVQEILTVSWCDEHRPTCGGPDDERANVGGMILGSAAEAEAVTNRPWCEFVHRASSRRHDMA